MSESSIVEVIDLVSDQENERFQDDEQIDIEEDDELLDWGSGLTVDFIAMLWLGSASNVYVDVQSFKNSLGARALETYLDWKGQEVDVVVRASEINGYGLFVEEDVPPFKVLLEYTGLRYPIRYKEHMSRCYKREGVKGIYMMDVGGTIIDATVSGGVGRFGNHSCEPNAYYLGILLGDGVWTVFLMSGKFLQRGTEVTFDYDLKVSGEDMGSTFTCNCKSGNCTSMEHDWTVRQ